VEHKPVHFNPFKKKPRAFCMLDSKQEFTETKVYTKRNKQFCTPDEHELACSSYLIW
jgi:hypothetical protein